MCLLLWDLGNFCSQQASEFKLLQDQASWHPFTFNFACQVEDKSAQELLMESQVWVPNPVRLQGWR